MGKKNKKNKQKGLAQHTDYCRCKDCNGDFLKKDFEKGKEIKEKSMQQALIPKFKHAKSCVCINCVNDAQNKIPTLDHTFNCICYKCKDKKMSSTGRSTSSTYSSSSYSSCHVGNVFVFKKDGVSVYGAGNLKDAEPNKVDIVLDLDRNVKTATWAEDLPKHFQSRERAKSKVIVLDLFIKDMHAPEHVTADFWKLFWQDLVTESKKIERNLKVLVMCQGGHGRTGVVITSLIMASAYNKVGIPKDVHPVGWLRKQYCDKAVESLRQSEYLSRTWELRFVSASKDSKTSFSNKDTDTKVPDDEVPNSDTICYECKTKRTAKNRILFSGDLKKFECDTCFGVRADADEKEADDPEEKDSAITDNDPFSDKTELCDGLECYDQYNDMTGVWSTTHTYKDGCDAKKDEDCGGEMCGFHTNSMNDGWMHTFDDGCTSKKGEQDKAINEMTDKEYEIWATSLL